MKGTAPKRTPSDEDDRSNFLEIDPNKKSKVLEDLKIVKDGSQESAPRIHKLGESSVLGRVKNFLPVISKANKELDLEILNGNSEKFDIENVKEDENVIELDLSVVPEACDGDNLPSTIQDLLNPAESSDSDSSGEETLAEPEVKKDFIREV